MNIATRRRIGAALSIAVLAALAGCGSDDNSESEAPATSASSDAVVAPESTEGSSTSPEVPAPATGDPIKFGMIVDLTANLASYDTTYVAGAKVAAEVVNAAGGIGGRPIELIIEDAANDPQKAVQAFEKLRSDGVAAFLNGTSSQVAAALDPLLTEAGYSALVAATVKPDVTGQYSMTPTQDFEAARRIEFLKSEGISTVGILHDSTPYNQSLNDSMTALLESEGIKVIGSEEHAPDVVDLRAQIGNLLDENPGAIMKLSSGPSTVVAAKALEQAGATIPMVLGPSSAVIVRQAAEAYDPTYFVAFPIQVLASLDSDAVTPQLTQFAEAFADNEEDPAFAAQGWDAVNVLAEALGSVDEVSAQSVASMVQAISSYEGASGTFDFSAPGRSMTLNPYYIAKIADGEPVVLTLS